MDGIQSRRFAEIERLADDYFRYHLAPVMRETQAYLTEKQGEEMKEYSTSLGGILGMMASSAQPLSDPYQVLKVTGEWNSKTTEDYISMCKEKILGSEEIQHDLAYMAGQWRNAVIGEVGRERYDELSQQLGCDLAYAYMDYRMEQLMIDKLVKDRMPKSSTDYIIRKAAQSSLLGLSQTLNRSPLAEEIENAARPPTDRARWRKVQAGCWEHRQIRSCWAGRGHGRHSQNFSVRMRPSLPSPRISNRKSRKRSLSRSVSAKACSAATATYSTTSAEKLPLSPWKRTRLLPKPTDNYRKKYRS